MDTTKSQNIETSTRSRARRRWIAAVATTVIGVGAIGGYLAYCRPWEATAAETSAHAGESVYTCPMHPQVIKEGPGVCPICFMDLVPKTAKAVPAATGHEGHDLGPETLALTERGRVIADVATTTIMARPVTSIVTASAGVDYNEATHRVITARVAGRVERLYVDRTGQYVGRGSALMEVYSPELVTAQQEYLIARETPQLELTAGTPGSGTSRGDRMVRSSRRRLELLGMSASQIGALETRGEIAYTTTVFAQASGIVVRRDVTEGGYLNTGAPVVELVDLSSVYVIANVPESMAWKIRPGQPFVIDGLALGNDRISGTVDYIYPAVDAASRTVRVRAIVANPGTRLKPGMFVTARIHVPRGTARVIPADAVIRTGKRDIVYVEVGQNMYEPREIELGERDGDIYEVVGGGVEIGDRVVAQGGYLLDAERRLQAPGANDPHAGHGTGSKPTEPAPVTPHTGH